MGTVANLNNPKQEIVTGNDNIVIVDVITTVRGGRTLNVDGYPHDVINAGHVILRNTATDVYKPMPLNTEGTAYGTLPAGHEYAGILIATIKKERPFAGILLRGTVNPNAAPFAMGSILAAVQTALPQMIFRGD